MPYLTPYHIAEQNAYALLGPLAADLQELERRAWHYAERLTMEPADRATMQAAHRALAVARDELERLRHGAQTAVRTDDRPDVG